MPELEPLTKAKIAVFGLGCIGAPSALELARAGIKELRLLDHDFVDAATVGRWPIGLSTAGLRKAEVLSDFIRRNYPFTKAVPVVHRLGAVRLGEVDEPPEQLVIEEMLHQVDLI